MGSAGSGKFGTYRLGGKQTTGVNGSIGSGGIGEIECPSIIENIRLEDVATSDYYINYQSLLSIGDPVKLHTTVHKGRLVIKDIASDKVLGNLPTQYNYLINCLKKGMQYTGSVIASDTAPVPFVVVTLYA